MALSKKIEVVMHKDLKLLQEGKHYDPFRVLGVQNRKKIGVKKLVRAFLPQAEIVELTGFGSMSRISGSDFFEYQLHALVLRMISVISSKQCEN